MQKSDKNKKKSFFARLMDKLDKKIEEKSQSTSCCGSKAKDKGKSCCGE